MGKEICRSNNLAEQERKETEEFIEEQQERQKRYPQRVTKRGKLKWVNNICRIR